MAFRQRHAPQSGRVLLMATVVITFASLALVSRAEGQAPPARTSPRATAPASRWGSPLPIDTAAGPEGGFADVSCASTRFCAAVDVRGDALTFNGTKWSRPLNVDPDVYGFSSVSCPRSNFCYAADVTGEGLQWNGKRWSAPRTFDTDTRDDPSPSVSCVSPSFCAAVDNYGYALIWRGTSWTHSVITEDGNGLLLQDISCTTINFCAGVDSAGDLVTWDGKSWSGPRVVDSGNDLRSVSCVSSTFCAAVGDAALILRYRGTSWTAQVADISVGALASVSCTSTSFCVTSDFLGDVYTWNGARWRDDGQLNPDSGISLSCRSVRFCAGVTGGLTGGGYGIFYAQVPEVLTKSLPKGVRHHHYSAKLKATGGTTPYAFSVQSGLPPGLKLSSTGTVAGTPKKNGHFTIRLSVRDPLGERTTSRVSLTIV